MENQQAQNLHPNQDGIPPLGGNAQQDGGLPQGRPHPIHIPEPPRRGRPIGAGYTPRAHVARHGITPPPFQQNNVHIDGHALQMAQNARFMGLPLECPIAHLNNFERICDLFKANGVNEDAYKLCLFPWSLGDKALQWERLLHPGSITTWVQCKDAFLEKFYPITRTTRIRNNITGFVQKNNETFSEALERFRGHLIECPHHDFTNEDLLSILYRGVFPRILTNLDIASNGSFLQRDAQGGWELIENMAASDGLYNEDYDRAPRGIADPDSINRRELRSLTERLDKLATVDAKIDKLLSAQTRKQVHVSFADDIAAEEDDNQFEEVSYVHNQNQNNFQHNQGRHGQNQNNFRQDQVYPQHQQHQAPPPYAPKQPFNNNYRATSAPPPGYNRPQAPTHQPAPAQQFTQAPPHPPQTPDITHMFQQLIQGQTSTSQTLSKLHSDIQRIDASQATLTTKFEQLNSRLQHVEEHQASSSVRPIGQLPGKSVTNPKEYTAKSITLRSGREVQNTATDTHVTEVSDAQAGGMTT